MHSFVRSFSVHTRTSHIHEEFEWKIVLTSDEIVFDINNSQISQTSNLGWKCIRNKTNDETITVALCTQEIRIEKQGLEESKITNDVGDSTRNFVIAQVQNACAGVK